MARRTEPRIHAILRADLKGLPDSYIMERLQINEGQLNRIRASELYKERFAQLQEKAHERTIEEAGGDGDEVLSTLKSAALAAAKKNIELLESETERVAQASAWDILNRTGYPAASRTEVKQKATIVIDAEALQALDKALLTTVDDETEEENPS